MKRFEVLLCCGVIALGLAVALYSDALRVRADQAYKDVMVLVDWQGLASLAPPSAPPAAGAEAQSKAQAAAAQAAPAADGAMNYAPAKSAKEQPGTRQDVSAQLPPPAVAKPDTSVNSPQAAAGQTAAAGASPNGQPSHAALLSEAHWRLLGKLPGAMLCYGEETISSLTMQGILVPARQRTIGPAYEVAVERYADDIYYGAIRHGYLAERGWFTGGKLVISMPNLAAEDSSQLPVCWLSEVRQVAHEHGVQMVLRPSGSEFLGPQGIARTFEFAKASR